MLGLAPKPKTKTPPPAKRWRNYYRVYRVLDLYRLGTIFPGVHAGPDAFPSKESAEEHATTFLAALNPPGRTLMEFAGAYPEGDAAH
jgi:hypothetical protein